MPEDRPADTLLEDRATLDRFRAGDRTTLAAVYRAHAPAVAKLAAHGFGFKSGESAHRFFGYRAPHEQQDCVQEVFARAFSERGRLGFDGIHAYGAYLRGILKNVVIDDMRKRRSALAAFGHPVAQPADGDALDEVAAPIEPADVQLQRAALKEAMHGFVDGLNEREKRFVALRYGDGLPQEAVAARMRVGRSTVRTVEDRVRRKLHDRLRARGLLEPRPAGLAARAWRSLVPGVVVLLGPVIERWAAGGTHG